MRHRLCVPATILPVADVSVLHPLERVDNESVWLQQMVNLGKSLPLEPGHRCLEHFISAARLGNVVCDFHREAVRVQHLLLDEFACRRVGR